MGKDPKIQTSSTYAYDSKNFAGQVTLNKPQSNSIVGSFSYSVQGISDPLYGLKAFSGNEVKCIWDRVKIIDSGVTSASVSVNQPVTVWFKAVYEYDQELFDGSKGTLKVNDALLTWSSPNQRWEKELTSSDPKTVTFKVSELKETRYGLTSFFDSSKALTVEWKQSGIPSYPIESLVYGVLLVLMILSSPSRAKRDASIRCVGRLDPNISRT